MGETLHLTGVNAPIEVEGQIPMIFKAINKVMSEVGFIGKDSKNQSQGFKYRGIDAVMNALNPALIRNGVFAVPTVLEQTREERTNNKGTTLIYSMLKVRYRFYAEDGSYIESTVIGEGMDSGDKASNKAMSVAFKYACFQVFCIPTEELMDDPDKECHEVVQKVDDTTAQAIKDARIQMKALRWEEASVFNGKTLEQLSAKDLQQAIGAIQTNYNKLLEKQNGTEK